jgi:hypothetical protein
VFGKKYVASLFIIPKFRNLAFEHVTSVLTMLGRFQSLYGHPKLPRMRDILCPSLPWICNRCCRDRATCDSGSYLARGETRWTIHQPLVGKTLYGNTSKQHALWWHNMRYVHLIFIPIGKQWRTLIYQWSHQSLERTEMRSLHALRHFQRWISMLVRKELAGCRAKFPWTFAATVDDYHRCGLAAGVHQRTPAGENSHPDWDWTSKTTCHLGFA